MSSENRKWYSLYDNIYAKENLIEAWKKVRASRGKPGYDGESIAAFAKDEMRNLAEIQRLLMEKRYTPPLVLRVHIPTVRDRIVQQAVVQVIEPIFEAEFCDCSYGFRRERNQHLAIAKIREYYEQGYRWVVDADLRTSSGR